MSGVKKQRTHSSHSSSSSSAMAAAKARASKKRLQKQPGAYVGTGKEIKAIDIAQNQYAFNAPATPPSMVLLNGIQTGAAFYNRIGSRVEMRSLRIRGAVFNAATDVVNSMRMVVIYDRQPNGAAPAYSEVFQARTQVGAVESAAMTDINLDQRDRFIIVRDIQYTSPSVTNTAGVLTNGPVYPQTSGNVKGSTNDQWNVDEFIFLKGLSTHFKSSTNPSVIGDINTGALFITFVTSGVAAKWNFIGTFRLRYDDA